jgi:adenylate cyclase
VEGEIAMERRISAILAADMVEYSRLMEADEVGTLERQKTHRIELIDPSVEEHRGRIVKTTGDGLLAEFPSVVEAVQSAAEIQRAMMKREASVPESRRIKYRIGINLGDVLAADDGDIYGDGVNVAARLEQLAEPGGVCISGTAYDQMRSTVEVGYEAMGEVQVRNIERPIRAYKVLLCKEGSGKADLPTPERKRQSLKWLVSIAAFALLTTFGGATWWWSKESARTSSPPLSSELSQKPSIAVLPFENLSRDAEDYLANGMTEDLITDLAKISGLTVIARNSSFVYKGRNPDVRQVGKDLSVRYVVEGSVRRSGGRMRINAQLIDVRTGAHIWADRYDRSVKDVFELQDDVISKIIEALQVELTPSEVLQVKRNLTDSPEAYDAYLRGLQQESFFAKSANIESIRQFEHALRLDPNFVTAMARLAIAHTVTAVNRWSDDPRQSLETARRLAEKAVKIDSTLPQAHWALARVYSRRELFDGDRAIKSLRKAIALDPNYADAYAMLANILHFVGRSEEALSNIEKAMRLNPHFPFWYHFVLGANQFMLTHYKASVESFTKSISRNPTWLSNRIYLVAAYGHLGMIDEAEWEIEELRTLGFDLSISNWKARSQIQDPSYRARVLEGLRKAGVPNS